MAENNSSLKSVALDQLNDRMIIEAYTGFDSKFKSMDKQTSDWVKHNFQGTTIIAERDGVTLEFPVDDLRDGDSLVRIQRFPNALSKLVHVNDKLIQELKRRGFDQFDVRTIKLNETSAQAKHKEAVQQTSELVQKVKESVAVRESASHAVENLMDNGRKGKTNTAEIMEFVDNIVKDSSADAISAIASLKESDQTYAHCIDVGAIFQVVYKQSSENLGIKNPFKDDHEMLLASFLHDFGKAKVPKEILDSTKRFERDSKEMQLMQAHPTYGAEMLNKMNMPDYIVDMAHYHHIKLDTNMASSYPKDVPFEKVRMEARLIAIIDIYQALVGKRSYKKSWAPPAAVKFIDQLSGVEYDLDIWSEFVKIMGRYPKGSAVELSDGSQAFVVSVPAQDLERPQVVQVRNSAGEDLSHHSLIDLQEVQDLSISKELDAHETFGENVVEVFSSLQVI